MDLSRLPEELLEFILALVKDDVSPEAYWNCLRTSRQWHRVGLGLYKGLGFAASVNIESNFRRCGVQQEHVASDFQLSITLGLKPPSQLYISLLKSFTLHIQHRRVAPPFHSSLTNQGLVQSLAAVFAHTTGLTTFSLRACDGWDFPNLKVPVIPQSLLAGIVEVLPETVVSLELDTAGVDVPPSFELTDEAPDRHMCFQISRILVRLRHLRLRTGHICSHLLPFQSSTQQCDATQSCSYCTSNNHATCALLRAWFMRSIIIWLPWGQTSKNNFFLEAAGSLIDPSLRNPTTILLIHQTDHAEPDRETVVDPPQNVYKLFSWTPESNVSTALRERLEYFNFKPISGHSVKLSAARERPISELKRHSGRTCTEHDILLVAMNRSFQMSLSFEPGNSSPYPYMAEQTMENMLGWTQNSHLSYRFPISEHAEHGKPFWKGKRLWACQFPGCKERCATLVHLRGHHMYAHPECPHYTKWQGYIPCPVLGCVRVGEQGFTNYEQIREHLLAHHVGKCTLLADSS